ncbi:MAG: hypothetical protein R6U50_05595 [Desulfobacterales bacterium]
MESNLKKTSIDEDWENRQLCSDGNCIGIIGRDGRCSICGLPADADPADAPAEPEYERDDAQAPRCEPGPGSEKDETAVDDWENRKLCSDGNCIGVIGPDGRCNVCGKPGS